ncbi:MAG: hypothetical protein KKB79_02190 [Nanoarchaeota archaeon]|nr:hypothetical protein [Nanoarchaeota archaeon]
MKGNLAEKSLENLETKKVSLNFDLDTLEFIDELSKITNTTRTTTIMSIIGSGMKSLLVDLENTWKKMKNQKTHNPEKINKLLKQINELKKKYNLN